MCEEIDQWWSLQAWVRACCARLLAVVNDCRRRANPTPTSKPPELNETALLHIRFFFPLFNSASQNLSRSLQDRRVSCGPSSRWSRAGLPQTLPSKVEATAVGWAHLNRPHHLRFHPALLAWRSAVGARGTRTCSSSRMSSLHSAAQRPATSHANTTRRCGAGRRSSG